MAVRQAQVKAFVESAYEEFVKQKLTNEEVDAIIKTLTQAFQAQYQEVISTPTANWLNAQCLNTTK